MQLAMLFCSRSFVWRCWMSSYSEHWHRTRLYTICFKLCLNERESHYVIIQLCCIVYWIIIVYDVISFLDYAGNFNANFSADGQRHYVRHGTRPVRHHDQVWQYCWCFLFCDLLLTTGAIVSRRNHPCHILCQSVWGFWSSDTSKSAYVHRVGWLLLQLCKHSCATLW